MHRCRSAGPVQRRRSWQGNPRRAAMLSNKLQWRSQTASWSHSKRKYRLRPIDGARAKDRRRKAWLVRRIGEMLRLEAEAGPRPVGMPLFPQLARQLVAGVELDPRFGGRHVERAAAGGIHDACDVTQPGA